MKNEAIAIDASRGARAFYRVLVEYGELRADPAAVLEDHEVARLLDRIPATTPLELRDRAMFELACGRGLDASELVRLDMGSLELDPAEPALRAVTRYLELGRDALAAGSESPRCSSPRPAAGSRRPTSGAACGSGRARRRCSDTAPYRQPRSTLG